MPADIAEDHRMRLDEMDGIIRVTQQRMERERGDYEKGTRAAFDAQEVRTGRPIPYTHTLPCPAPELRELGTL